MPNNRFEKDAHFAALHSYLSTWAFGPHISGKESNIKCSFSLFFMILVPVQVEEIAREIAELIKAASWPTIGPDLHNHIL